MNQSRAPRAFWCCNGMRFTNSLIAAADGDVNVVRMFLDNLERIYPETYNFKIDRINKYIENMDFISAIGEAFPFNETNEGAKFWEQIKKDMVKEQCKYRFK